MRLELTLAFLLGVVTTLFLVCVILLWPKNWFFWLGRNGAWKDSDTKTFFCSCGGALTEQEYQTHRSWGHDEGINSGTENRYIPPIALKLSLTPESYADYEKHLRPYYRTSTVGSSKWKNGHNVGCVLHAPPEECICEMFKLPEMTKTINLDTDITSEDLREELVSHEELTKKFKDTEKKEGKHLCL